MRGAARIALLIALGLAAGCSDAPEDEAVNNAAVTEVEALPPDESAATPTDELRNGAAEPVENGPPQD